MSTVIVTLAIGESTDIASVMMRVFALRLELKPAIGTSSIARETAVGVYVVKTY